MKHNTQNIKQLAEVVTYSGRLGEARMALLVVAARALRAAASLSASTAGEPPPQEVPELHK